MANNIRAFIDMQDAFEDETLDIMPIQQIIPNQPCCSLYNVDQSIYRSVITDVNLINDTATIQYVDYGNVSEVPLEKYAFNYRPEKSFMYLSKVNKISRWFLSVIWSAQMYRFQCIDDAIQTISFSIKIQIRRENKNYWYQSMMMGKSA